MNMVKYIGMDVHMAMTVIAVLNREGKLIGQAIIETKSSTILDFIRGQRGTLHVTFEEAPQATWLSDLISPYVAGVVVCNPRKITAQGNKADKPDAKRLAELLRTNALTPVYHGDQSTRPIKELVRSYNALVRDSTRIKNRIKGLFRGRGISCRGGGIYSLDEREQWLSKLDSPAARLRAGRLLQELDCIVDLVEHAGKDLSAEARKHASTKILKTVPGIGRLRAAVILGLASTPYRFRTIKQFWTYCGLAVVHEISAEYEMRDGQMRRAKKQPLARGLNRNYNRALKETFKGAAKNAAAGEFKEYFDSLIANGMAENLALLTVARKIASITLAVWKRGERYDSSKVRSLHAA